MKRIYSAAVAVFVFTLLIMCGCTGGGGSSGDSKSAGSGDSEAIEKALDLSNMDAQWTYDQESDAWVMSSVTAVTNPEIENEQGVSVCVPGAYVKGIDTDARHCDKYILEALEKNADTLKNFSTTIKKQGESINCE